jgi:hypothetical protein
MNYLSINIIINTHINYLSDFIKKIILNKIQKIILHNILIFF